RSPVLSPRSRLRTIPAPGFTQTGRRNREDLGAADSQSAARPRARSTLAPAFHVKAVDTIEYIGLAVKIVYSEKSISMPVTINRLSRALGARTQMPSAL